MAHSFSPLNMFKKKGERMDVLLLCTSSIPIYKLLSGKRSETASWSVSTATISAIATNTTTTIDARSKPYLTTWPYSNVYYGNYYES